jgi:hypothetical protein
VHNCANGAAEDEIDFLRDARVELNAMPSDVFIAFLERKLAEHGVEKVIPDDAVLERHARQVLTRELANRELARIMPAMEADATAMALPADLGERVKAALAASPGLSWDLAVAYLARRSLAVE